MAGNEVTMCFSRELPVDLHVKCMSTPLKVKLQEWLEHLIFEPSQSPCGLSSGSIFSLKMQFIQSFINTSWYNRYEETPSEQTVTIIWSLIVSMYAVGGMFGAVSVKFISGLLGRWVRDTTCSCKTNNPLMTWGDKVFLHQKKGGVVQQLACHCCGGDHAGE